MRRIEQIQAAKGWSKGPRRRRGMRGQRPVRDVERDVRRSAVALLRWLVGREVPATEAARRIGMKRSTLLRWDEEWRTERLEAEPLGRPAARPEKEWRNDVLAALFLLGAEATEETLARIFPGIARAEIRELRQRYRTVSAKRYGRVIGALRWTTPGRVWALDFTTPPTPVDGIYPAILAARDLASDAQLMALPCRTMTAEETIAALRAQIAEHGAPLLVKWDNGSAFIAEETRAFLESQGILALYSPPGFPQYNGSCEAGIGGLKTRAHHIATRFDRPGEWTSDDVEGARELGNETARSGGRMGTPAEAWARRKPIDEEERRCFLETVEEERQRERKARGLLLPFDVPQSEKDSVDRVAISHALIRCDLLLVRRRRIPQPVYAPKCLNIS